MIDNLVRVEQAGSRVRVIMNRPDARNAFNAELIAALRDVFADLSADESVRSIVLAGEGKTFSGGADIAWMRAALDLGEAENVRDAEAMAAMFVAIDRCPKPVIARVQGAALGGGCGLVAAADIVVAANDAVFGFTEVKLGIIPAVISPFVIAKIGVSAARALFVTGERFDAARAQRIGLVHYVVPADKLDDRIDALLEELRTASPSAIAAAKMLVRDVTAATPDGATSLTARAIAKQRTTPEGQEGLRAFLERRPAGWHDR
ncbi:MAG TPA: enoyl-CoA hydratase-related protein [Candidatus Lustribacter sp.]|nr:enoyl-CoA hydratase-related protein [Candidatus Lustribacter sp.]